MRQIGCVAVPLNSFFKKITLLIIKLNNSNRKKKNLVGRSKNNRGGSTPNDQKAAVENYFCRARSKDAMPRSF